MVLVVFAIVLSTTGRYHLRGLSTSDPTEGWTPVVHPPLSSCCSSPCLSDLSFSLPGWPKHGHDRDRIKRYNWFSFRGVTVGLMAGLGTAYRNTLAQDNRLLRPETT